jgi:hypothetical protein
VSAANGRNEFTYCSLGDDCRKQCETRRKKSNHMSVNACEEGGGDDLGVRYWLLLRLGAAFLVSL